MFIYFPEYVFNKFKTLIKSTFKQEDNKESITCLIKEKLKDEDFRKFIENFEESKIILPVIKFSHCFGNRLDKSQIDLGLISNYDKLDNKIEICKNYLKNKSEISNLIMKELSYAIELNKKQQINGLNDYAILSISSCRKIYDKTHHILNTEIIKRCAYLDFKYRFKREIKNKFEEDYPEMDNLKLNEISKKLIDFNFK